MSGPSGVEELFATVVRTVGESLDVASVDLWTFSRDTDSFECRAYWSRERPASPDTACVGTVVSLEQSGDLRRLFLTGETVEHHVARIRRRLGAESRSEMLSMLRAMLAADEASAPGI